ncbi:uncharacterized protein LY79DRAFT_367343 [Colletotrichum navitas]|uniref:Uncharacterized protein n=1 Tax=Colletotrichum navitas TaxID=681940 RepID=A0AAD8V076_9PEZI|nr:uncharacterized protein LY79DRAFT_367343 [Colletotrichum navitas]KAK1574482.1 hypothetical protein LY79DRAFT_367343 [Colletotrichum navitas]
MTKYLRTLLLACGPVGASHPVVSTSRPFYPFFYFFLSFSLTLTFPCLWNMLPMLPLPQSAKANAADLAKATSGGLQRRPLSSLVAPKHPLLHPPPLVPVTVPVSVLVPAQSASSDSPTV